MPDPPRAAAGDGSNGDSEKTMAKAAGIIVFSGIALSILKTLSPFNNSSKPGTEPLAESTQATAQPPPPCCRSSQPRQRPLPEPLFQVPVSSEAMGQKQKVVESVGGKAVEIVKGDTLWGLSTKYGVSVQAIKEANGLKTDTIYAGKKLIIPLPPY